MELTIYNENDMWTAHVNEKIYPLMPASRSLLLLVKSIQTTHPNCKVFVAQQISNNPYLANYLVHRKWLNLLPDYTIVQQYLDKPDEWTCDYCECPAWYNEGIHTYQCTNCRRITYAIYTFDNDTPAWQCVSRHFFKLSRFAKHQGGNLYRTKEATTAIVKKKMEIKAKKELEYVEMIKVKYNLVER